jgi:hypothetical protein
MRQCGCDWDVAVFGHAYCWATLGGFPKHVVCQCAACPCDCHTWTGDHVPLLRPARPLDVGTDLPRSPLASAAHSHPYAGLIHPAPMM